MKFLKERLKDPHVSEAAKFALIKKLLVVSAANAKEYPPKLLVMMWVMLN